MHLAARGAIFKLQRRGG